MSEIKTIEQRARQAINTAVEHYFDNLTEGEQQINEATAIGELIQMSQPWLFSTEQALTTFSDTVHASPLMMNLIQNLTVLFYINFNADNLEVEEYNRRLADSLCVIGNPTNPSIILNDNYRKRVPQFETTHKILAANRFVVTMITIVLFLQTGIITEIIDKNKRA